MSIDRRHARVRVVISGARTLSFALALLGVMASCSVACVRAQALQLNLRESLAAGLMTSSDQIKQLDYDKVAVLGGVQLGQSLYPWLEVHMGAQAVGFFSIEKSTGGLLDLTLGGLLRVPRKGLSPYVSLDAGGGMTGNLIRPYVSATVGLDTPLAGRHRIGPVFGYGQLIERNGKDYLSDAHFLWFGLSLRQGLGKNAERKPAPPPRVIREREVVVVTRDAPPLEPLEPLEPPEPPGPSADVLALIERALPSSSSQRVELLAPVLFAVDSDKLEPTGVAMLHEVQRTLETRVDIKLVQIEGYADQRGSLEYNRALSERRAQRVQAWLVEHGIAPERLRVAPLGESSLVEPGTDNAAHEQNRRVIFRVLEQETSP